MRSTRAVLAAGLAALSLIATACSAPAEAKSIPLLTGEQVRDVALTGLVPLDSVTYSSSPNQWVSAVGGAWDGKSGPRPPVSYVFMVWVSTTAATDPCEALDNDNGAGLHEAGNGCAKVLDTSFLSDGSLDEKFVYFATIPTPGVLVKTQVQQMSQKGVLASAGSGFVIASQEEIEIRLQGLARAQEDLLTQSVSTPK